MRSSLSPKHLIPTCEAICTMVVNQLCAWCMLSVSVAACGPTWNQDDPEPEIWSTDSREPVEIALDVYEQVHGEAQAKCMTEAYEVEFQPMDSDALAVRCGTEKLAAAACYYQNDVHGPKVAVDEQYMDSKRLLAHEIMHVVLECHRGNLDGDGHHTDAVWKVLDPGAIGWNAARRDWGGQYAE